MKIQAHQIRSIVKADMEWHGIAVLQGGHMSGKTSLLNTVGACLVGDPKVYGATRADDSSVRRSGARLAPCSIQNGEDWSQGLAWPSGEVMGFGQWTANEVTIGRCTPIGGPGKAQWATFVRGISGSGGISLKSVAAQLRNIGLDGEQVIMRMYVLKHGATTAWDDATNDCERCARECRRQWETLTQEKFGSSKADGWVADNYADIDDESRLEKQVQGLKHELDQAGFHKEVMGGSIDDLKAEIRVHKSRAETLKAEITKISDHILRNKEKFSQYPTSRVMTCPCCQTALVMQEHGLAKAPRDIDPHFETRQEYIDLRSAMADDAETRANMVDEAGKTRAKLEAAESTMRKMSEKKSDKDPDALKSEYEAASKVLGAYRTTKEADETFIAWKMWTAAAHYLGPSGARMDATKAALKELQPRIDAISEAFFGEETLLMVGNENGVSLVFDVGDRTLDYGQLVWNNDPCSYALRVQIMFQVLEYERLAKAGTYPSPIIIDRFDTLLREQRNAVLVLLHKRKIPALIGQAAATKPSVDKLANAGVGRTFWIEDGIVESV